MSVFYGVPRPTLERWLSEAQTAFQQVQTGAKAVTVTYGMGDGQKSVTYNHTNQLALRTHIDELMTALGRQRRRRAITPYF